MHLRIFTALALYIVISVRINLIFNKEGQLKLIDFGAAKNKKKEKEEQYCKGGYTAPEQYLEKEFVGPWSDVYSLCAVWYEMLTGIKVPPAVERLQKDRLKNMTMALKCQSKRTIF